MGTVTHVRQTPPRQAADFISRLHGSHGAQLQRFLTKMLGRRETAEEVAQETYLKLHRLVRPEEVVCPQALLFDVATKLAINHLRKSRTEAAVMAESSAAIEEVADDGARPERRVAAEQTQRQLAAAIEQLAPSLRQPFVLRYVMQMSRQEVAGELKISVGAVEQRLTRALAQCRARLAALDTDWLALD